MPLVGAARTGVSRSRRRAGGSSSLSSTLPISRCAPSTGRSRVQQKRQPDTQGIDSTLIHNHHGRGNNCAKVWRQKRSRSFEPC